LSNNIKDWFTEIWYQESKRGDVKNERWIFLEENWPRYEKSLIRRKQSIISINLIMLSCKFLDGMSNKTMLM
jgi:hypothetical protein